ncbi:hypothetical protein VNO78_18426 [Psophocarpus tetragonolobus]|uniref:Uncharacterized protein n=1 Tax=Psophocarpus tetragonolobus TaxID=3891 RepID=A0AAN9XM06_PSOTE
MGATMECMSVKWRPRLQQGWNATMECMLPNKCICEGPNLSHIATCSDTCIRGPSALFVETCPTTSSNGCPNGSARLPYEGMSSVIVVGGTSFLVSLFQSHRIVLDLVQDEERFVHLKEATTEFMCDKEGTSEWVTNVNYSLDSLSAYSNDQYQKQGNRIHRSDVKGFIMNELVDLECSTAEAFMTHKELVNQFVRSNETGIEGDPQGGAKGNGGLVEVEVGVADEGVHNLKGKISDDGAS